MGRAISVALLVGLAAVGLWAWPDRGSAAGTAAPPAGSLLEATWGSGQGQLGRSRPREGNREAPPSFTVDAEGRLLVLDRANGRTGEILGVAVLPPNTMPEESFRDLAVLDDGTIVYMVRDATGVAIRTYRCG